MFIFHDMYLMFLDYTYYCIYQYKKECTMKEIF